MEALAKSGWRLSPSWTPSTPKDALIEALNSDLKDVGEPSLADLVAAANESGQRAFVAPPGGIVLQISKVRNVSAPKVNEESGAAPRMLKLSLTDGHTGVQAVEVTRVEKLSMTTPPGTKIRLREDTPIPYVNGFLQLAPQLLEVLGGKVEALVEKWEISRKLAQFTRAKPGAVGGPPPWIPFGKKIVQTHTVDKNFKALADKLPESKESAEFDSQRQDAIEEAAKQGGKKVFGGGKAEIKEASSTNRRNQNRNQSTTEGDAGASSAAAPRGPRTNYVADDGDDSRGGRRRGRGRGRNDDGDDSYAKPTSGVSLFDFLEKEFPGAHDTDDGDKSSKPPRDSEKRRPDEPNFQKSFGGDLERGETHRGGGGRGGREGGRGRGDRGRGNFNRNEGGRFPGETGKNQEEGSNPRQRDQNRRENTQRYPTNSGGQQRGGGNDDNRRRVEGRRGGEGGGRGGVGGRGGRGVEDKGERRGDRGGRGGGERGGGRGGGVDRGRGGDDRGKGGDRGGGRGGDERGGGRSGKQAYSSDRDFGEWSNSTYLDSTVQRHQQRPQQHHHDTMGFEGMHLNDGDQRRHAPKADVRPQRSHQQHQQYQPQQQHVNGSAHQEQAQERFQKPPPQQYQKSNAIQWKEGMMCLTKYWEDGQYYTSRITGLTPKTAMVLFQEYGNHEEVYLTDLLPLPQSSSAASQGKSNRGGPFIPATPGLPPAFPQS